jgi:autotransporter-associated beta strand protein
MKMGMKSSVGRTAAVLAAGLVFATAGVGRAQDLYWGGSNTNINDGVPPAGGAGWWDDAIKNWATSSGGTTYTSWLANATANFGGLAAVNVNLTNKASVAVGGLSYAATGAGDYNLLDDGSTRTITLSGSSPVVKVDGDGGAEIDFTSTYLVLAGSSGFTKTGSGIFLLSGRATNTISGTINVNAGDFRLTDGKILNVSTINVARGSSMTLNANTVAASRDRLSDSLVINLAGGALNFNADASETTGVVNVRNYAAIAANTTANGNLAIGTFDRGARGVVRFTNLDDTDANITINGTKPPTDAALPWAATVGSTTGNPTPRFVQYTSGAGGKFALVTGTAADPNLPTWDTYAATTDLWFEWTSATKLTNALDADVALNTLAVGPDGTVQGENILGMGGNTITAKGFSFSSTGGAPGSTLVVSNGYLTATDGTEQLYIHSAGTTAVFMRNVAIGKSGASDLTYDVIFAAGPGNNTITWTGNTDSVYSGTMYVNIGTLTLGGTGLKATGDLVLEEGAGIVTPASTGNLIADTGVVTLNSGSTWTHSAGNSVETVGGIAGTGGSVQLGSGVGSNSKRIVALNNGTNLTFAGTIYDAGSQTGSELRKAGNHTWTLTGNNTYGAETVVTGGVLRVNGTHSNTNSGRGYKVYDGATLGGSGLITLTDGNVNMYGGSKLSPGASTGTVTMALGASGSLNLTNAIGGSYTNALVFELGAVSASDKVLLTSGTLRIGTGLLNFDDFEFTTVTGFPTSGTNVFVLFDTATAIDGSLGSSTNGMVGGYKAWLGTADSGHDITLTVIPEPATLGTVALGVASLLWLRRRRERNV